jgi:ATP-dependent RNA helicase RhlB
MEFSELKLHPDLERGLSEAGYITCMPVQEQVLQNAFGGQDLYVQSQTGTGKTAAFLIVIFQRLLSEEMLHGKKAIIMVPTRELAVQVEEEAKLIGKYLPFKIGSFYGGVGYTQQTALLRANVEIMVGTPGRVLDLNQSGQMNLMDIAFLVLDEADRMFDMGFYPDLRKLIRAVPPADRRQTMLFSATLNAWVKNLAWEYTRNPFEIAIEPETVTVEEVEQLLYHVSSADKMKLLLGILKRENPESAIIFCNTKRYAEIVAKRLRLNGYDCEFIMGDLPQTKRLKIIEDIKAGKIRFLVATDVAARGLDIESLAVVVNFDLPNESENYVHRIGRTARAGKTGKAFTLASEQDVYELPGIERYIGQKIPSETATEELFAEDKSEGKRIHTDFYEERDRKDRDGHARRRDGGSRDGRGERGERGRRRPGPDRRPAGQESRERKSGGQEGRGSPEKGGRARNVKLSELSLEERMAYYREKYGQDAPAVPQNETVRTGGTSTDSGQKKPGGRAPGKTGKRGGQRGGESRRENHRERSGQPRRNVKNQTTVSGQSAGKSVPAQSATAAPAGTAEKKGIFSRILGIFRKK